jgi:tRNA(His) 5'-end guanylyltransferase
MSKLPWQIYGFPKPKSEASRGPLSLVDWEIYSGIEIPDKPVFVRLDGWKFHGLCQKLKLRRPYDRFFAAALAEASKPFFSIFGANLAYIFSDEINLLFLRRPGFARIEKIDSVFAGIASSVFTAAMRKKFRRMPAVAFDCRAIPMLRKPDIARYLIWRQAECFRNHNNSWAHHALVKSGLSPAAAQRRLSGMGTAQIRKMLKEQFGLDLWATPTWQRNGLLMYKERYLKTGWDPIKKKKVRVERWRLKIDWSPPLFREKAGKTLLKKALQ